MWLILSILFGFSTLFLMIRSRYLKKQIKEINKQLVTRRKTGSTSSVGLQLFDSQLNELAGNINTCIRDEEDSKLIAIRKEKEFHELITNVSHDLRTPLTALKSYLQLMERGELSNEQEQRLGIALKHTANLEKLVQQFFEYAYLTDAQILPSVSRLCVTALLTEVIVHNVPILEERGVAIRYDDSQRIYVNADKELVVRIFQNIIKNGAAHAVSWLEVKAKEEEKDIVISFSNPIRPDSEIDVIHLFDRFYTADKSRITTGLGLSIVKMLTEQMNGQAKAALEGELLMIEIRLPRA